jgi:gas vesicle protein
MKNVKVLLYTVTGLLVGFGIGLLAAPVAGRDVRYRLKYSAGKLKKKLGINGENEFSESEMEMDATNGRAYGL